MEEQKPEYVNAARLPPADRVLRESEAFFLGEGQVHKALRRLAQDLEAEAIPYVLIGGMALSLWGFNRQTVDIDILLTREGLSRFQERLVGRGYVPAFAGATKAFREAQTQVKVEVMTTGEYPGDGKPKPVVFPDPVAVRVPRGDYSVITLEKLIELKLASGLSAAHRLRDLADVQDLIARLKLPRELSGQLDASVRAEYVRLWEVVQTAPHDDAV